MNNKLTWFVIAIIVLGGGWLLLSGKGSSSTTGDQTGPIKVGVLGPFTGDAATYGEPFRNVVEIAVAEINAAGGVNGRQIEAVYEDGKCDSAPAVSAAQKLIATDGVQVIIGGFCSGETIPVVPIAAAAKVFVVSPSASSPALTGISPFFARTYPSDSAQGKVLADIAVNDKQWKLIGFIQEQTDYAAGIEKAFAGNFTGTVDNQQFSSDTSDFRSVITKLRAEKVDALFVDTQTPASAQRILKQVQESGWKPQIILNDVLGVDKPTLQMFSSLLEGALTAEVISDPSNAKLQALEASYKTKYGTDMPYVTYSADAYDATYMIRDGIVAVGYDGAKLAAWSRTVSNWAGASGPVTIQADGDRAGGHSPEVIKNAVAVPYTK